MFRLALNLVVYAVNRVIDPWMESGVIKKPQAASGGEVCLGRVLRLRHQKMIATRGWGYSV